MHLATAAHLVLLAQQQQQGGLAAAVLGYLPIVLLFVVAYFAFIRPQRRRTQEAAEMLRSLDVGDDVVTIGGLHGRIHKLYDDAVDLEVTDDMVLRFDRQAIAKRVSSDDAE